MLLALAVAAAGLAVLPAGRAQAVVPPPIGALTVCQGPISQLVNPSFEDPVGAVGVNIFAPGTVPGWQTTDPTGQIEIWRKLPGQTTRDGNAGATDGVQIAELNAFSAATMFQDVPTTPGAEMVWSLDHRARGLAGNVDVMRVEAGPPAGPLVDISGPISDGITWGHHLGSYTVPAGQTVTRFAFQAVSTATGDVTMGNLLDNIVFETDACLQGVKTVTGATNGLVAPGGTLTYAMTITNTGGSAAGTTS
jgi:hypothetical protein